MKLILHLGMDKTGTTAIQLSLTAMRAALLERGVLYPSIRLKSPNHNFLTLLTENPDHISGMYRIEIDRDPDFMRKKVFPSWEGIVAQIAEHKPSKLILSSEMLLDALNTDFKGALLNRILSLSDDIHPIIYTRKPSAHYLSRAQQRLKNAGRIIPPGPANYRRPIEQWEQALGRPAELCAYERAQMTGEDSTTDFLHRVLSAHEREGLEIVRTRANETLSAESMAIIQDFRRMVLPDRDTDRVDSSTSLRRILSKLDKRFPGERPALRPEIAHAIDHSSTDLLWLRERSGIVFQGIDYDSIRPPRADAGELAGKLVADICMVDAQRKSLLASCVINELHSQLETEKRKKRDRKRWQSRLFEKLFGKRNPAR